MRSLIYNEILGCIAIQEILRCTGGKLSLANSFLIPPLLLPKKIRVFLKDRRVKIVSSKDLVMSQPEIFVDLEDLYQDFLIMALNSHIVALEIGMISLRDNEIQLNKIIFNDIEKDRYGVFASEISQAAHNAGILLNEPPAELYANFRISL